MGKEQLWEVLHSNSFLERSFLKWVLAAATTDEVAQFVRPQGEAIVAGHLYRIDYELVGSERKVAVELDGFEFHGDRRAFTYDRLRQNDLQAVDYLGFRFSYDAVRLDTARCVAQLQAVMSLDPALNRCLRPDPEVQVPDDMDPDPLYSLAPPGGHFEMVDSYFDLARKNMARSTLRQCQREAFSALGNYFGDGGRRAACVMSVGSGKTALGVAVTLGFARQRALIVTPGNVIRGTFQKALDHQAVGNVLYGLPGGPLIPGIAPPQVLVLDRDDGPIRDATRANLLQADVIVTNFHSLGDGNEPDDLLSKLDPDDIDLIVVDEAHIAASASYQRLFGHFTGARSLLMSACFQRLDGQPIDADVVYRYRLIDSIADGNAKNMLVHRFAPHPAQSVYEMVWPDGAREEIVGRDAILEILNDERRLARVTAKSDEPIRQLMKIVRRLLDEQRQLLHPLKPRVLFSALGERHAEQIARIATEHGIPADYLHHTMSDARIRRVRQRFEQDSGDLEGVVQLKMLGQGYDFPPITVVVPLRPYGSFAEFYQFVGRGIRVLQHPSLEGRVGAGEQVLDIAYHADLGLDQHIDTIYEENDMDPLTVHEFPTAWQHPIRWADDLGGSTGIDTADRPETFVLFERGAIESRIVHDEERVESRRAEREQEAMAQRYAEYAQTSSDPITFHQFLDVVNRLKEQ